LSLRLHADIAQDQEPVEIEDKEEENKAELESFTPLQLQNKQQRTNDLGGRVASPANRKARVSVRARCEAATVSFIYHLAS
jgi:hypothetical protein